MARMTFVKTVAKYESTSHPMRKGWLAPGQRLLRRLAPPQYPNDQQYQNMLKHLDLSAGCSKIEWQARLVAQSARVMGIAWHLHEIS